MQRKRRKNERRCCDKQTVIQRFEKSRSRRIYPASKNTVLCSAGIGAEPQQAKESPTSASAEMGDLGRLYIQRHCLLLLKITINRSHEISNSTYGIDLLLLTRNTNMGHKVQCLKHLIHFFNRNILIIVKIKTNNPRHYFLYSLKVIISKIRVIVIDNCTQCRAMRTNDNCFIRVIIK